MDDASKIQQINNIARELMKDGQATTMEEAMQKAQAQMSDAPAPSEDREPAPPVSMGDDSIETAGEAPQSELDGPVQEEQPTTVEQPAAPEPTSGTTACTDNLNKLHSIVSQQETTLSRLTTTVQTNLNSIAEFNDKINKILAEIADIKAKLSNAQPVQQQTQPQQTQPNPAPQQAAQKPEDRKGDGHARTGNYNPDDVSVEKVFYCGPK